MSINAIKSRSSHGGRLFKLQQGVKRDITILRWLKSESHKDLRSRMPTFAEKFNGRASVKIFHILHSNDRCMQDAQIQNKGV